MILDHPRRGDPVLQSILQRLGSLGQNLSIKPAKLKEPPTRQDQYQEQPGRHRNSRHLPPIPLPAECQQTQSNRGSNPGGPAFCQQQGPSEQQKESQPKQQMAPVSSVLGYEQGTTGNTQSQDQADRQKATEVVCECKKTEWLTTVSQTLFEQSDRRFLGRDVLVRQGSSQTRSLARIGLTQSIEQRTILGPHRWKCDIVLIQPKSRDADPGRDQAGQQISAKRGFPVELSEEEPSGRNPQPLPGQIHRRSFVTR